MAHLYVDVVTGRDAALEVDLVGLAVTGKADADVTNPDGHSSRRIRVSDRIHSALAAAGVTDFEAEPVDRPGRQRG